MGMEGLGLEQASFVGDHSAILALKNIGDETVEITWYSIDWRPSQGKSSPVSIRPGGIENFSINTIGQGYRFEKGKLYEVRVRTHRDNEFVFTIFH
jgi:hypothetical protein